MDATHSVEKNIIDKALVHWEGQTLQRKIDMLRTTEEIKKSITDKAQTKMDAHHGIAIVMIFSLQR